MRRMDLLQLAFGHPHHRLSVTSLGQTFRDQSFTFDGLEFLLLGRVTLRGLSRADSSLVCFVLVCDGERAEMYRVSDRSMR